ncbi:MAG: ChrR family anti-sigma-E factor [Pseudomonadota bacterium]
MSDINHHPRFETLADFAAGRLDEARAVVIATHAALCSRCAGAISDLETIGGAMLSSAPVVDMSTDALERVLAKAGDAANIVIPEKPVSDMPENRPPLAEYLTGPLDDVSWKPVAPGVSQSVLEAEGYRKGVLRLLKIQAGTRMPKHSHKGEELTLILRGAYTDNVGKFQVGDLADLDGDHLHEPEAIGDEPCICLIATSAPLEFKTMIGKIAQPFVGL